MSRCEICGDNTYPMIEILGSKICIKCLGYHTERTRRGPIRPKPRGPIDQYIEEQELQEKVKEWIREPEILEKELERMKEAGEMAPSYPAYPEEVEYRPIERPIAERIKEKLTEAFGKVKEAISRLVEKIREWLHI